MRVKREVARSGPPRGSSHLTLRGTSSTALLYRLVYHVVDACFWFHNCSKIEAFVKVRGMLKKSNIVVSFS